MNTWQSRLVRSVPQLSWTRRRVLPLVYRQPGTNYKWPRPTEIVPSDHWASAATGTTQEVERAPPAPGPTATSPRHRPAPGSAARVSGPRRKGSVATCFLFLLGRGMWQPPDFKVNAKGRALYLTMTRRASHGSWGSGDDPPSGCSLPSKLQLWLGPRLEHKPCNEAERKLLQEPGKTRVHQPALSESPLHDYLRISKHYLQARFQVLCGNGRRELGAATPLLLLLLL